MKQKLVRTGVFSLITAILILNFQNCSKVNFADASTAQMKIGDVPPNPDGTLADPPNDPNQIPNVNDLPTDQQPPVIADPSVPTNPQLDPRELVCEFMNSQSVPEISYDSRNLTGSAPVSISSLNFSKKIEAEHISQISGLAVDGIEVLASKIDQISGNAMNKASFNAQSIDSIQGNAGNRIESVAHQLGSIQGFAGDLCISAQSINSIQGVAARLSLFGRSEGGQKAVLKKLDGTGSFLSVYNFDFESGISGSSIKAKFVNSHIPKIENSSVDIILIDSTVDEISEAAGVIHLRGNSKVLKQTNSALIIKQE